MATAKQIDLLAAGVFNQSGVPLSNGTAEIYETGTTTLATVWEDANKVTVLSNPVSLSERGTAIVFADGQIDITLKDSNGNTIDSTLNDFSYSIPQTNTFGVDASQFGDGDDSDAIQQAITSAGGADSNIILKPGEWDIDTNLTIPTNINLQYLYGAYATIQSGITLTYNGTWSAPLYQIHRGAGTLVFDDRNNDVPSIHEINGVHDNRELSGEITIDGIKFLPKGFINGFKLSNGTDSDHDIDIQEGEARAEADDGNIKLSSELTKQIDVNWVEGDDAGGFPSALTLSNNAWYHVFAIYNPTTDTVDAGFDTSLTATNLLSDASGYSLYRRLGSILTDGSANILSFYQNSDVFMFALRIENLNTTTPATSKTNITVRTPPNVITEGIFVVLGRTSSIEYINIFGYDEGDRAPAIDAFDVVFEAGNGGAFEINRLSSNSTISYRADNNTIDALKIFTRGYKDFRGKDGE